MASVSIFFVAAALLCTVICAGHSFAPGGLVGPSADLGDNTLVDRAKLAALCGEEERSACAELLEHVDVRAGVIEYPRIYAQKSADTTKFPDALSKENGFSWFVQWESDKRYAAANETLFVWFNGGPGSPPTFGGFTGVFPLLVDLQSPPGKVALKVNTAQVTKYGTVLAVDTPRFTGYSNKRYQAADPKQLPNDLDEIASDFLAFLERWFEQHPHMQGRKLFLVGESWGGQMVSRIGQRILQEQNEHPKSTFLNEWIDFRGVMLGGSKLTPVETPYAYMDGLCANFPYVPDGNRLVSREKCQKFQNSMETCPVINPIEPPKTEFQMLAASVQNELLTKAAGLNAVGARINCDSGCWWGTKEQNACCYVYCAVAKWATLTAGNSFYDDMEKRGDTAKPCAIDDEKCEEMCHEDDPQKVAVNSKPCDKQAMLFTTESQHSKLSHHDSKNRTRFVCKTSSRPEGDAAEICPGPVNGLTMSQAVQNHMKETEGFLGTPNYLFFDERCHKNGKGYFPPICRDLGALIEWLNLNETKKLFNAYPESEWLPGNFWVWSNLEAVWAWPAINEILQKGIPMTLYYGKRDGTIWHSRGFSDARQIARYYFASLGQGPYNTTEIMAQIPYSLPRESDLQHWPAPGGEKKGEVHNFHLSTNANVFGKPRAHLRYIQLDAAGHEVPIQKPEVFEKLVEEVVKWGQHPRVKLG